MEDLWLQKSSIIVRGLEKAGFTDSENMKIFLQVTPITAVEKIIESDSFSVLTGKDKASCVMVAIHNMGAIATAA